MNNFRVAPTMVRDQAAEKIKEAILSGFLQPGQRLVERALCEMCGVSRTSIREALRVLEGEKLIVNLPHRGPRVATPTAEEAQQIYEVRAVLEGLLGRWAAINASDADIEELKIYADKFDRAVKQGDLRDMVVLADEYFALLAQAARQEIASDLLRSLRTRISTLRATSMSSPGRGANSSKEMRDILKAIIARDPDSAAEACARHVRMAASAAQVKLSETVESQKKLRKGASASGRA